MDARVKKWQDRKAIELALKDFCTEKQTNGKIDKTVGVLIQTHMSRCSLNLNVYVLYVNLRLWANFLLQPILFEFSTLSNICVDVGRFFPNLYKYSFFFFLCMTDQSLSANALYASQGEDQRERWDAAETWQACVRSRNVILLATERANYSSGHILIVI